MKPSQLLRRGFCKYALAKDSRGRGCGQKDSDAVAWCILGAVWACEPKDAEFNPWPDFMRLASVIIGQDAVHANNDPHATQADMVALAELCEEMLEIK